MKSLCTKAGYHAPVNFAISVEPILICLEHSQKVMEVIIPLTFTQGNIRCSFRYENDRIILSPAEALNGVVADRWIRSCQTHILHSTLSQTSYSVRYQYKEYTYVL